MKKNQLLTVGTVAQELEVSRYRIHQLINEDRFPNAFQVPSGQWLIPSGDLTKAIRNRKPGRPKSTKKGVAK
jgi:hypothetical protein